MFTARDKITINLWDAGTETEFDLMVKFTVVPVSPQTLEQPAEPAFAEIQEMQISRNGMPLHMPRWLRAALEADESLCAWLLSEARDADEFAREQKADADRDERQLERNDHV